MRWTWLVIAAGIVTIDVLRRVARHRRLSTHWLADNQRREWSAGHEGAAWNWNSAPAALMAFRERERK